MIVLEWKNWSLDQIQRLCKKMDLVAVIYGDEKFIVLQRKELDKKKEL